MSEKQRAKETAIYIAVRNGFGLFKRGNEIHKIYAIGTTTVLCTSQDKDMLWRMACEKLKTLYGFASSKEALEPAQDDYWEEILPPPVTTKAPLPKTEKVKTKAPPKKVSKPKKEKKKIPKPKVSFELPNAHLSWKEKRELLWEQQRKEREKKK